MDCEPCGGVTAIGARGEVRLLIESSTSDSGVDARDEPGLVGMRSEPGSGVGIAWCGGIDIGCRDDWGGPDAGPDACCE